MPMYCGSDMRHHECGWEHFNKRILNEGSRKEGGLVIMIRELGIRVSRDPVCVGGNEAHEAPPYRYHERRISNSGILGHLCVSLIHFINALQSPYGCASKSSLQGQSEFCFLIRWSLPNLVF